MITYIIQVVLFQVLFLAVYDFLLSKETFHNYNRWYLLGTPLVSFVLPLIKIPTFQKAVPEELMVYFPEILLSPQKVIEQTTYYTDYTESSVNYFSLVFWIGTAVFCLIFFIKLFKIFSLIRTNETIQKTFYKLVLLPKQTTAFSFFNFIFLGKNISKEKQEDIIQHELIHSKQKHSLDLLFFEFLRIAMWFNPMIYIYQQRITLLHEYISDAEVVKTTEKHDYFNKLLAQTFQVENISFVNQFYKHSLIKKRITMMTKNKSKHIKKAKYLLLLPLLASMLVYTSCGVHKKSTSVNKAEKEEIVVKKELQTWYMDFQGTLKKNNGKKETYTDYYIGNRQPKGVRIEYKDLSAEEKKEYDVFHENFQKRKTLQDITKLGIYRGSNGRVVLAHVVDYSKMKKNVQKEDLANNLVPFAIIEEVPEFPGCTGTRKEKSDCLSLSLKKHVVRNFNIALAHKLGLTPGKKKIWIIFRIDENGEVTDVNARAPHPALKAEAIRVVNTIPRMKPGKQKGRAVGMKYTLPISFNIAGNATTEKTTSLKETEILNTDKNEGDDVSFSIIEEVPVYPGCTGTREQQAACLNKNIKKFVVLNFNTNLLKDLGLSTGVKKIWLAFKIDAQGDIVDVQARASHSGLEQEAVRVARLLPKMKPGKQGGKAVGMKYTLPISFNIAK